MSVKSLFLDGARVSVPSSRSCATGAAALLAALLQGCGGGGSDSPSSGQLNGSTNHAPTISGSPAMQAEVGKTYTFTPTASDADGNTLSFTITNQPSWASFDRSKGTLSGTPAAIGTFSGITISVSDGTTTAALPPFAIVVAAAGGAQGSATLSWTPPTQRSDGSSLTNLAGYKIHYGTSPDSFGDEIAIDNPGLASYTIDALSSGTYYFTVTAVDATGVESQFSSVVSKTIG